MHVQTSQTWSGPADSHLTTILHSSTDVHGNASETQIYSVKTRLDILKSPHHFFLCIRPIRKKPTVSRDINSVTFMMGKEKSLPENVTNRTM